MASQKNIQRQKQALVAELDGLRSQLGSDRSALAQRAMPSNLLKNRLGKSPLKTFGLTCLATAVATSLLRRRKPKPKKDKKERRSTKGLLFSTLMGVAQPILKKWLTHWVSTKLQQKNIPLQ